MRLSRFYWLLGALLFSWPQYSVAQQLRLRHLGKEQGLSDLINVFIHRAKDGRVYISSMEGLNVYDGDKIRVYRGGQETPGDYRGGGSQSPFFETPNGDIWFGTETGLIQRSGNTDQFSTHFLGDSSVMDSYYAFFLEKNRYLWVKKEDQLFRFDTRNTDSPENSINRGTASFIRATGVTDKEGNLTHIVGGYYLEPNLEIHRLDTSAHRVKEIKLVDKSAEGKSVPPVRKALMLDNGCVFGLFANGLVALYPGEKKEPVLRPLPPHTGLARDMVKRSGNEIWILCDNGLWSFTPSMGFEHLAERGLDLFPKKRYGELFLLTEEGDVDGGSLWVSKYKEGVFFADPSANHFGDVLRRELRRPESIQKIVVGVDGAVAVKTANDHYLLLDQSLSIRDSILERANIFPSDESGFTFVGKPPQFRSAEIGVKWVELNSHMVEGHKFASCRLSPNSYMLVGGNGALLVKEEEDVSFTPLGSFTGMIIDVCPMPNNRIVLMGGDGYLTFVDNIESLEHQQMNGELAQNFVQSKNLGVGTDMLYDHHREKLWVTSSTGLYAFNKEGELLHHFTVLDGLKTAYIQAVALSQNGDLWLSSNQGIFNFCPDRNVNRSDFHFTLRDGLSADEFNRGAAATLPDGRLAFGSVNGLDVFHPDSLRFNQRPPQLLLRELRIHDRPWSGEKTIHRTEYIERPYTENTLSFTMAAPDYFDPERVSYAFFMTYDGGKTDTFHLGYDNSITLPNLTPGNYRFGFTAANAHGFWNPDPHWLSVYLRPPFWQTIWFRLLMGVGALAIVSLITSFRYRYRLRVEEARRAEERRLAELREAELRREIDLEEQRRNITSRMHNDVGGSLTTLSMLSSRLSRTRDLDAAKELNDRIGSWVKDIRRRFGSFIRMVNPQFDSLKKTIQLLRTYTAELLTDNGIQVSFKLPPRLSEHKLPPDYRLSLFQAVQEVLNNCIKYANASNVVFAVAAEGNQLSISITDDGDTFIPRATDFEKGIGLTSLRDLTLKMGGEIRYAPGEEKGTRVTLSLQLPDCNDGSIVPARRDEHL